MRRGIQGLPVAPRAEIPRFARDDNNATLSANRDVTELRIYSAVNLWPRACREFPVLLS